MSARYLVAHSIKESGWGTSAIAQQKHNLFGYGADDSNPFGDAMSFPSFTACILYVAQEVKQSYLTPGGAYYHGPTLRGMNVDYASDPSGRPDCGHRPDGAPPQLTSGGPWDRRPHPAGESGGYLPGLSST